MLCASFVAALGLPVLAPATVAAQSAPSSWEELGGSASGGGISATAMTASQAPQLQMDAQGRIVVMWMEVGTGIHLRRWNGSAWEELGGSGSGGGVTSEGVPWATPAMALGRAGEIFVAWTANQNLTRIYLKKEMEWERLGGVGRLRQLLGGERPSRGFLRKPGHGG